jgi:hydroxymethylpyrimidine pyrophosphatase-like HAD family hydrolase
MPVLFSAYYMLYLNVRLTIRGVMKSLFKPLCLGVFLLAVIPCFFNREPAIYRRARGFSSLNGIITSRDVRAVILDLDFTLAESGQSVNTDIIEQIFVLNREGMHIAIVSGAFYETIDNRMLSQIRAYSETYQAYFDWTKFYIFPNTGSEGFKFNHIGTPERFFHRPFSVEQSEVITQAVRDFRSHYGDDSIVKIYDQSQSKVTLYFKTTGVEAINDYLGFFHKHLEGLGVEISSSGSRESIDITTVNKGEPLNIIKDRLGLQSGDLMVVGDSFKDDHGNDRPMLLEGALIFNVGEASSRSGLINTSDYLDPNIAGVEHTLSLLTMLVDKSDDFMNIFQSIRFGQRRSYSRTIDDSGFRIEIYGQHFPQLRARGAFSSESGFLAIRVFDNEGDILAYSVIYPTYYGYNLTYSRRANKEIGDLAEILIAQSKDAFGLESGTYQMQEFRINPRSAEILGVYLTPYFYQEHIASGLSSLEAFVLAVDSMDENIVQSSLGQMPDVETIERRMTELNQALPESFRQDFNNYYLYYYIIKSYPGGAEQLRQDLEREIEGNRVIDKAQTIVAQYLAEHIRSNPLFFDRLRMPRAEYLLSSLRGIVEALSLDFRYVER